MRNLVKFALSAALIMSVPVTAASATRPSASVPAKSKSANQSTPSFNPIYFVPIGISIAIIAYLAAHKDKKMPAPKPVSRG